MQRKLWAIASSAAVVALMVFFFGPDESEFVIAAALPLLALLLSVWNPGIKGLVLRHAGATRVIGAIAAVAATVGLFGLVGRPEIIKGFDLYLALVLAALGGGMLLVFLPNSLRKAQSQLDTVGPDQSPRSSWSSALTEIGACWRVMLEEKAALLRIGLPYLLLTLVACTPLLLAHGRADEVSRTEAAFIVFPLLLNLLLWPGLPLAWCRYMVAGGPPKVISPPYMAFWSVTWRLLVVQAVSAPIEKLFENRAEELAASTSISIATVQLLLSTGATVVIFWFAAPMALILPAIAAGAPKLGMAGSATASRATAGYLIGVLGVVAPFWIVCLSFNNLGEEAELGLLLGTTAVGWMATILGIIAFSTYVSRAYLRAAASEALPAYG